MYVYVYASSFAPAAGTVAASTPAPPPRFIHISLCGGEAGGGDDSGGGGGRGGAGRGPGAGGGTGTGGGAVGGGVFTL